MRIVEGQLTAAGVRAAIVAGRFNAFIVDRLVEGAVDALRRAGADEGAITLYRAPGSFEIPQVARRVLDRGGIDCLICVGAVIRGGTPHFDYVAGSVTSGLAELSHGAKIPVAFGILTTEAIEMVSLYRAIQGG